LDNLWSIKNIVITGNKRIDSRVIPKGAGFEGSPPGSYEILYHKNRKVVMSSNAMELEDMREFVSKASGHVVVGGLGLAIVVNELLKKESIKSITIIEIEQSVIDLTGGRVADKEGVSIIKGDVRTFNFKELKNLPDFVYIDIWDDSNKDSYKDRLSVLDYWSRCCDNCYAWALDRSKEDYEGF
jgi:hypothetical protein